jgi:hypothetical protein
MNADQTGVPELLAGLNLQLRIVGGNPVIVVVRRQE